MDYFFLQIQNFSDFMQFYMMQPDTTYKGPGYCYVLPKFPSSGFLGHMTGLFFFLYVKILASSVYAIFDC